MDTISVLRQQLQQATQFLEVVMQGVTPQQAHWHPPGKANPIGASYIHAVMGIDVVINGMLKGGPPLAMTSWAGKTGVSEMATPDPQVSWFEWGRRVKVDLAAARLYAQAVCAEADAYLKGLKEAELERKVNTPRGPQTVLWVLSNVVIGHVHDFTGEISCLKGLQGLKGYPI